MGIRIETTGLIHTAQASKDDAPIQGAFRPDGVGAVEIFPEYAEGRRT